MLRVTGVQPLDDDRLRVVFNDGVIRKVDCSFLLRGTLGEPLRDPEYFRQAHVDEDARSSGRTDSIPLQRFSTKLA